MITAQPRCGADVYVALAGYYAGQNQADRALVTYTAGAKLYPGSAALQKALGAALLRNRFTDIRAGEFLAKAAKSLPRDAETHFLYGQWACASYLHELCIVELQKAAALEPANDYASFQIFTLTGMAQDQLKRPHLADAAFRKAMIYNARLPRRDPNGPYRYVEFLSRQDRDDEAQRLLDEILRFAPDFSPAHLERAKYMAMHERDREAAEEAERALACAGGDSAQLRAAHAFLAKTYTHLGQHERAAVHARVLEEGRSSVK